MSIQKDLFYFSAPIAIIFFIFLFSVNIRIFQKYGINYETLLDLKHGECPSARQLAFTAFVLALLLSTIYSMYRTAFFHFLSGNPALAVSIYYLLIIALIVLPIDIFYYPCRKVIVKLFAQCIQPTARLRTPFVQVFFADGLTTLSKPFQDVTVALGMAVLVLSGQKESVAYKTQLQHTLLPYLAASAPYVIRCMQCIVSYHAEHDPTDRFLHLLNTFKYLSGLAVIITGALPIVIGSKYIQTEGNLFILCVAANSLYSICWDIIMDWGLGQPGSANRFLREKLIYETPKIYYVAIVLDVLLRVLWISKWSQYWTLVGADFKFVAEMCEVFRRALWNCIRVEWESVKKKTSEEH